MPKYERRDGLGMSVEATEIQLLYGLLLPEEQLLAKEELRRNYSLICLYKIHLKKLNVTLEMQAITCINFGYNFWSIFSEKVTV